MSENLTFIDVGNLAKTPLWCACGYALRLFPSVRPTTERLPVRRSILSSGTAAYIKQWANARKTKNENQKSKIENQKSKNAKNMRNHPP